MASEMADRWRPFLDSGLFSSKFEVCLSQLLASLLVGVCPRDFILLSIWIHAGEDSRVSKRMQTRLSIME